jgi:hypothetical protein
MAGALHEALEKEKPGWRRRATERRAERKELAYFHHHAARKILAPLRHERRP